MSFINKVVFYLSLRIRQSVDNIIGKNQCVLFKRLYRQMDSSCDSHIVWIDTELTGLDIEKDTILEVACLITDKDVNVISKEFNVVINQSDAVLSNMNEWSMDHHEKTGLIKESKSSKVTLKEAEQMLLDFLKTYISKGICPVAGNTVHMDCLFLRKHMPLVINFLHYRSIDVTTIKELARRWNPLTYKNVPKKKLCHRALPDIRESMKELKYYQENIFLAP